MFNPSNGYCLACVNMLQIVTQYGECVSCEPRQFVWGGKCHNVNPICLEFNPYGGSCYSCIDTYILISGSCWSCNNLAHEQCKSYECGIRQYYDTTTKSCKDVSPLCQTFNSINWGCTSCKNSAIKPINGDCIESSSLCKTYRVNQPNYCLTCNNPL